MKQLPKPLAGRYAAMIARVAAELCRRGWAEANAGNFSVRVQALPETTGPVTRLAVARRRLAGCSFVVKRAGARMRDIALDPVPGLCLVQVTDDGRAYHVLPDHTQPSTEIATHLAAQEVLLKSRQSDTTVLHTHPTATIALSLMVANPRELVPLLTRMHSEGPLVVQGRVTAIGFAPPGTEALARVTAAALRRASGVIWPGHGTVTTGADPAAALDLVEIIDKLAAIALQLGERRMLSAGLTFVQEMAVREAFDRD